MYIETNIFFHYKLFWKQCLYNNFLSRGPFWPVKQMLVLEASLIRPTFSVERESGLMYGTRCLLPDVVQAVMKVWHVAGSED